MSESQPNKFEGMDRAGFRRYVKFTWEAEGRPKHQVIIDNALEIDPKAKLTTSTISSTLKGTTFPRLGTAKALGLGLGGEGLAKEFEQAWREAEKNHREQVHDAGMRAAKIAQEKAREERLTRAEREGDRYPSWWPARLRGQALWVVLLLFANLLVNLWVLLWEYPFWRLF
ncbi:hypothetical protein JHN59_08555 [Streptomyces sp. MBT49]|uniref:hypothetical protein n=1 Tax=unclassified Streptomyces TaxID=2593676 RepID=UPI00190E24AC|nr:MULTISPECIES: hypothetical protein [unclassified Streptomyces]MBK3624897.1 hypothetical protein [Streptomyces sp. MBT49]MBK3632541.1 hypothetical protein [Streptomyces sp. MBT97]